MTGQPLTPDTELVHGTCLEIGGKGVLILGPPGSGKSDLALRLIDQPGCGIGEAQKAARLVADDQVLVRRENEELFALPPPALAGKLEIRGIGIVETGYAREVRLRLCIRLTEAARIERLPDAAYHSLCGVQLRQFDVDPRMPSAAARVRAAVDCLDSK